MPIGSFCDGSSLLARQRRKAPSLPDWSFAVLRVSDSFYNLYSAVTVEKFQTKRTNYACGLGAHFGWLAAS